MSCARLPWGMEWGGGPRRTHRSARGHCTFALSTRERTPKQRMREHDSECWRMRCRGRGGVALRRTDRLHLRGSAGLRSDPSRSALSQLPAGTEIHLLSVNSELVTTPEGDVELLGVFEMVSPDRTGYPLFVLQ